MIPIIYDRGYPKKIRNTDNIDERGRFVQHDSLANQCRHHIRENLRQNDMAERYIWSFWLIQGIEVERIVAVEILLCQWT